MSVETLHVVDPVLRGNVSTQEIPLNQDLTRALYQHHNLLDSRFRGNDTVAIDDNSVLIIYEIILLPGSPVLSPPAIYS